MTAPDTAAEGDARRRHRGAGLVAACAVRDGLSLPTIALRAEGLPLAVQGLGATPTVPPAVEPAAGR